MDLLATYGCDFLRHCSQVLVDRHPWRPTPRQAFCKLTAPHYAGGAMMRWMTSPLKAQLTLSCTS